MNKKSLSESDICDRYISPALLTSGWDETRWRREYAFTAGRIIVRGELVARGKQKRADISAIVISEQSCCLRKARS
jgi:type I restriction enzyme R subunit